MISLQSIFGTTKPLIGMVHILPTTGYEKHPGLDACIAQAVADAKAIEAGGGDGILVENDNDQPHTITISEAQKECIRRVTAAVRAAVTIPVGVNVLLNDWKATLDIARVTRCAFVRIDVFVDRVDCPGGQGIIEPEAEKIIAYRRRIGGKQIALFADIQVKHKMLLEDGKTLATSARQARNAGADGVIVSGKFTGVETPIEKIIAVKCVFPDFPVLVGSGLTIDNSTEQFTHANGGIVGTWLKDVYGSVSEERVRALKENIQQL